MATKAVQQDFLTVKEVLEVLRIAPSTWYQWRQIGKTPKVYKLPNGQLRIRRSVLEDWLADHESEAA